ncbi:hypothetical protein D3C78_886090 [compost metagenome]
MGNHPAGARHLRPRRSPAVRQLHRHRRPDHRQFRPAARSQHPRRRVRPRALRDRGTELPPARPVGHRRRTQPELRRAALHRRHGSGRRAQRGRLPGRSAPVDPRPRPLRGRHRPRLGHLEPVPRQLRPLRQRGVQLDQLRPPQLPQLHRRPAVHSRRHLRHPAGCAARLPRLGQRTAPEPVHRRRHGQPDLGARRPPGQGGRRLQGQPRQPEHRRTYRVPRLDLRRRGQGRLHQQRHRPARRPPDHHPWGALRARQHGVRRQGQRRSAEAAGKDRRGMAAGPQRRLRAER